MDEGYLYDADRSILTGNIGRQRGTRDVYLSIGEREDDRIPSSSIVRRFVWEHPRQGFLTMVLTCVGVTRLMEGNGCRFCGAWTTVLNHNNCLSGKHAAERRYDVLRLRACATCTPAWWRCGGRHAHCNGVLRERRPHHGLHEDRGEGETLCARRSFFCGCYSNKGGRRC